ncbi:hypothetical protein ABZ249_12110 [Nocardiopsis sp. NPDC006139]|uniref:hypothetical protein n=1 Tax=Nocardiopsis sp. NPDC006139 TaxID=3154578 RepID=UPI0033B90E34
MGWCYTHDQAQFAAAARLHGELACWWVLWSPSQRRYVGFWCGPQAQEPVHAPDEEALLARVAEVERELVGFPVSVPARATPTERLHRLARTQGVTVTDHPTGVRLGWGERTVLAALRPDTTDGAPVLRWWVSWTDPAGAHARPIADPGQEGRVLAHLKDLALPTVLTAPHIPGGFR